MLERFVACLLLIVTLPSAMPAEDFLLEDGERVIFLGNTLIEREQEYGDWELQLTLAAADRSLTFRNLGWSGDTVWAESRGLFDPPAAGYARMIELVKELKPTTIVIGYGTVEAFRGPSHVDEFQKQYQKLRRDLLATGSRLMHLSPLLLEASTFPVKSQKATQHIKKTNRALNLYADAIQEVAAEAGELFIDFRPAQHNKGIETEWMQNGIHLTQSGYAATARVLVDAFGGTVRPGEHPELRQAIQRKNELFFHRWRPQNFTYLLGFRKHEQGQNAVEIAQFDPLIAEIEEKIRQLQRTSN